MGGRLAVGDDAIDDVQVTFIKEGDPPALRARLLNLRPRLEIYEQSEVKF